MTHITQYITFSEALRHLKEGLLLTREGWNGKHMYIKIQNPDKNSMMNLPYIYIKTADDKFVPWVASQQDILSEDWKIIK